MINGLDKLLLESDPELSRKRIGLIINHTSVDQDLKLSLDVLLSRGYKIKAIFAPEHGFRGNAAAGEKVAHQVDKKTGIPIYSLYGDSRSPSSESMKEIDAFVFDIQDIGVRYYTYIYTLAYSIETAAKFGLDYYVLDRPNPITGDVVEGNIINSKFDSFVGKYGLPIRHGMTVGELATYFNNEYKMGCKLTVIKMEGWEREKWFDELALQWIMPSPNATGIEMAALYPGTCLFEGTNVSEGRGTTRPFEMIGAPWIDAEEWYEKLQAYKLDGVMFRPTHFTPTTSKYAGELCEGIQVHIVDRKLMKPLHVGCAMIESLKNLYPSQFKWLDPIKGRYFIDLLAGTDQLRLRVDGKENLLGWLKVEESKLEEFKVIRKKYLLY
ncbi:DUF1343 domain-containing protein [Bacillus luteolus]|uniref:DUF1343 domain-containing protein n=1 Tax=Litchfieldia luteola TaxID=682179 RepID=A0ABR9QPZ9_9BACI|nr:DUF1343 domain-containing protein [Cytobacillus luteolus]MBE4910568.1 DUF1343 domain-containing protein [Cytobacillus luteolus]MBP1943745.1 uncharacterized protein YbbC (DUF1343 family) [Cytobacillus luteolus]